jgi:hypothetical protein
MNFDTTDYGGGGMSGSISKFTSVHVLDAMTASGWRADVDELRP